MKHRVLLTVLSGLSLGPLVAQMDHWETVVYEDSLWRYSIPSAEPDSAWTSIDFDDAPWSTGIGGLGYGDGDDGTVLPACVSVYMRQRFAVPDTSAIAYGLLDIDYDDGFVAYLNGVEIARSNLAGAPPAFDALAAGNHEAALYDGGAPERFLITDARLDTILRPDSNVIAVQVHNVDPGSSDLSARPWLSLGFMDANAHGGGPTPAWFVPPMTVDSTDLPLVVIDAAGQVIPDEPKITAHMRVIDNGPGQYNHISDPANVFDGPIGIEVRGVTSETYPQSPYSIETRDPLGMDSNVVMLDMPAEHDWVLLSNWNDKSFARNVLASAISQHMGQYAPRFRLAEVVVDHDYKGVYLLGEKIKRDANRVDIARLDSTEIDGDDLTGGYIWKVDYWSWGAGWWSTHHPIDHPELDVRFVGYYPETDDIAIEQAYYLMDHVDSFETALYSMEYADPMLGYRAFIDVKSFIDYFLVNEISRNEDGFKKSYFFHKDRLGPIRSGPIWDFDWAWKNIDECSIFSATDGSGWAHLVNDCTPDVNSPGYYVRMLQDSSFAGQLGCVWQEYRSSFLSEPWLEHIVDSIAARVYEAQQRHFSKYPILGVNNGTPEVGPIPTTFQGEVDALKAWIATRMAWLDANLPACSYTAIGEPASAGDLHVFPNPARDRVFIRSAKEIDVVRVADAEGREIFSARGGIDRGLDISKWRSGLYAVQVMFKDGGVRTTRFGRE
jgi:hypothetical protein